MSLNLITKADFIGFLNIVFDGVTDAMFITYADQLDEMILTWLFGYDMYKNIAENQSTVPNKYLIDNFLKPMQRGFFYWYFLSDRESFGTTIGEFEALAENAKKTGWMRNRKMVKQFNTAVDMYLDAETYVNGNIDKYPEYSETKPIDYVNLFDI